jgi:flagellar hook-associated protein 2
VAYIGSLQGTTSSSSGTTSTTFTPGSGISGLASGIDTDSMVQGLMGAAQVPLVELLQQRQILQWQEIRYQQVNASLSTLQNAAQTMQLQSTFMANTATSSNPNVITATANTLVPQGNYSVTVQQLAQGATVMSSTPITTSDANYPSDTTLSSVGYGSGVNLIINGESFSFQGTDTLQTVLDQIKGDPNAGVSGFFDTGSNNFVFQTTATGSQAMMNVDSTTAAFFQNAFSVDAAPSVTSTVSIPSSGLATAATLEINGQKIQLQAGAVTSDVETAINNVSSSTGVTATTNANGNIVLNSSTSGSQLLSLISVSESDSSDELGFQSPYANSTVQQQQVAQDAQYVINGLSESSSTNQATYNGLSLNLVSTSSSPVQIGVSVDAGTIANSITNFVQQYNQTLQLMQGLYNENRNYNYQPLTSSQESQMTQTQIDQWNEQAQMGMLADDPTIGGIMNTMENDMQNIVSGQPQSTVNGQVTTLNSLASIGITPINPLTGTSAGDEAPGVTTSGWNSYGLLQIDPTQLQAAIQADPQAVMSLFTNNPSLPGNNTNGGTGIGVQLYQDISNSVQTLTQQAGVNPNVNSLVSATTSSGATVAGAGLMVSTAIDPNANFTTLFGSDSLDVSYIGSELQTMDTQATSMQQQLNNLQTRYQTEFSQMEQSMSNLSSQSSGLTAMLGGGSSSSGS